MWFNSTTRRTLPGFDIPRTPLKEGSALRGTRRQVLHGCRQLVSRDVGLSPATSATPIFSYHHSVGDSRDTAPVNGEEGGDDVKSSWPLCPGLHTCYNGLYKGLQTCEGELIPKSSSKFGLESATRLHEVGIASNRGSACRGEYVPGPCTHRPSHHESWLYQKLLGQPIREAGT